MRAVLTAHSTGEPVVLVSRLRRDWSPHDGFAMASPNPTPTSAVPPKVRRSREIVLSTSLELVDAEGLDALTMRRLGQEPGRDPMSLYRYAANRTALQDGVAETVLNELAIFADDPDWQAQLRKSPTTCGSWPCGIPTSSRCWSPGHCPHRWVCTHWAPSGPSNRSWHCS